MRRGFRASIGDLGAQLGRRPLNVIASDAQWVLRYIDLLEAPWKQALDYWIADQYNDRWVWPPPHLLAHGYPNTRTDETLTPQELHGLRSSDDQQGAGRRGWPGWWLQRGARHELSSPPAKCSGRPFVDHVSTSPCVRAPPPQLPQQAPARLSCHVLRSCLEQR